MVPWKVELNQSTPFLSCDQPFYKEERTSKLFIITFKNLLSESKIYLGTWPITFGLTSFPNSPCLNKTKNLVGFNFRKTTKFIPTSTNANLYFISKFLNLKPILVQTLILFPLLGCLFHKHPKVCYLELHQNYINHKRWSSQKGELFHWVVLL